MNVTRIARKRCRRRVNPAESSSTLESDRPETSVAMSRAYRSGFDLAVGQRLPDRAHPSTRGCGPARNRTHQFGSVSARSSAEMVAAASRHVRQAPRSLRADTAVGIAAEREQLDVAGVAR